MKTFAFPTEPNPNIAQRMLRASCMALFVALFTTACGDYSGSQTDTSIAANSVNSSSPSGLSVADQVTSFEATVFPLLRQRCTPCHATGPGGSGSPKIAEADPTAAWSQVVDNQKVNFSNPSASRLVRRLASDFHFCWDDCAANSNEMLNQILAWQNAIEAAGGTTGGVNVAGLTSDTRTVNDGREEVGEERFNAGIIARWDFKEETGNTALDTSGIPPAMDLELQGDVSLMTSYGIDLAGGRAIATAANSRKLYDLIASPAGGTQAYSLELWIANANTTQDGPARIATYSRNNGSRNFMLAQNQYQYVARNRTYDDVTSNNGTPEMETYDVDQDAQSTLQHVVLTYDQINGRVFYVDGRWTDDLDEVPAGRLWNWDPSHRLAFGDEVSGGRPWLGQVRFAAIYNQALTEANVRQNYDAGIGKRVTLAFNISEWTGGSSVIEFSLTQLDEYSYLFCSPTFVSDTNSAVRIQNMRISINGVVPVSGQGFTRMNALVTSGRQLLSRQCSVIGGIVDPMTDEFQLVFEQLGIFQDPVANTPPPPPGSEDFGSAVPVLGVRSFDRVNATMATLATVDPTTPVIASSYDDLVQQLPSTTDMRSFVSANQVGVAKLGTAYCDILVGDGNAGSQGLRDAFFPGAASFPWDQMPADAFDDPGDVDLVTDPLIDKIIGSGLRGDVNSAPARDQVEAVLDQLIADLLTTCGGAGQPACDADYTKSVVKGVCAATLSSGAVHIH
jgi:hypothetical protein